MDSISVDDFLQNDYYQEQKKMIEEGYKKRSNVEAEERGDNEETIKKQVQEISKETSIQEEMGVSNPKKRKYERKSKIHMRDDLNGHMDKLEALSTEAISKNVQHKIAKDMTLPYTLELDSVDGFSDTVKNGVQYISEIIAVFKKTIDKIIGAEFINMITHLIKGIQQNLSSTKNLSLSYLKEIFNIFETFINSIARLAIL